MRFATPLGDEVRRYLARVQSLHLRMPRRLLRAIRRQAAMNHQSLAAFVREAIKERLKPRP